MTNEEQMAFLADMKDYAKVFTSKILSRLSIHYNLYRMKKEDVETEVKAEFLQLARNFKPKKGGRSLRTYCYEYGYKKAMRKIQKQYNLIWNNLESIPIEEYDEEVHHQYGTYLFPPRKELIEVLDERDTIDRLFTMADEIDKKIMILFLSDFSMREIEKRIGISHQAISKRLQRLGQRFKDWENKPLGKAKGLSFYPVEETITNLSIVGCQIANVTVVIIMITTKIRQKNGVKMSKSEGRGRRHQSLTVN